MGFHRPRGGPGSVDWCRALSEIRSGRTLWHVLRERGPGRPEQTTWYKRVKRDPEFAAVASAALETGLLAREASVWTGRFTCDEEVDEYLGGETVECLLCRVADFQSLGTHLASEHATTVDAYRDRFGIPRRRALTTKASGDKLRARPAGGRDILLQQRQERRQAIDWRSAETAIEAGAKVRDVCTGLAGAPSRFDWQKRRSTDTDFQARTPGAFRFRAESADGLRTIDSVADRIQRGATLLKATDGLRISLAAIRRLRARDERFGLVVREAILARRRIAQPKPQQVRPNEHLEIFRSALRQNEIYAVVDKALPRWMPPEMRDDVRSEAILAVIENPSAAVADVVKQCVRDYGRMFNRWQASLDDEFGEGGFTRGDTLAGAYFA